MYTKAELTIMAQRWIKNQGAAFYFKQKEESLADFVIHVNKQRECNSRGGMKAYYVSCDIDMGTILESNLSAITKKDDIKDDPGICNIDMNLYNSFHNPMSKDKFMTSLKIHNLTKVQLAEDGTTRKKLWKMYKQGAHIIFEGHGDPSYCDVGYELHSIQNFDGSVNGQPVGKLEFFYDAKKNKMNL